MNRFLSLGRCSVVLCLGAVLLVACGWTILAGRSPFAALEDDAAAIESASSGPKTPRPLFCAPGLTEPASRVLSLVPSRAGRLVAVTVGPGDPIEIGDILAVVEHAREDATIRAREAEVERAQAILDRLVAGPLPVELEAARARLVTATGDLGAAVASLELACRGPRAEEIAEARARLDEAEAWVRDALWTQERHRRAASEGAMPESRSTEAETAVATSRARAAQAEASLAILEAGTREEEIRRASALVESARGRLQEAEAELARLEEGTRAEEIAEAKAALATLRAGLSEAHALREEAFLRSPLAGIVVYRHRHPGEHVSPEDPVPVLDVATIEPLKVRVDVDEFDVARVQLDQPVYATAPAFGTRRFPGRVELVERTMGRKNFRAEHATEKKDAKILEVVVVLDPLADGLPLGMPLQVWFLPADRPR